MRFKFVVEFKIKGDNLYLYKFNVSVLLEEFIDRYNGCISGEILDEEVSVVGLYVNGYFILIFLFDLVYLIIEWGI